MTSNEPLGLRERKRVETRRQLERAAVTLVLEVGLEHATVEAISESIPVSPRTFFNYFDSKEDAVLGVRDTVLDSAAIAAHLDSHEDATITESVTALLFAVIGPTVPDAELRAARMEVITRYPHLLGRQFAQLTRMGETLTAAIVTILERDPAFADQTPQERATFAELILPLFGGAVRLAVKEWIDAGGTQPREQLETRANALIREAQEKLR